MLEQKPPSADEIRVAFPLQHDWQLLNDLSTIDLSKLFMAKPPPSSVPFDSLTPMQRWAIKLGVDESHKILYLCGKAGCGKTEIALHICERLKGKVQAGAGTGKAASNFNGPTVHSMFGWSFNEMRDQHKMISMSSRKLSILRTFYADTEVFVVDEINAMSAAMLAQLDQTMRTVFDEIKTFGGKKMIFMGDPAQLKPVFGESICGKQIQNQTDTVRKRTRKGSQIYKEMTKRGQELYRQYLAPHCILFKKGQRNCGLLQMICDRLRDGTQDETDLDKLTFQFSRYPNIVTDFGIHYENEACCFSNWHQLWTQCTEVTPNRRLYLLKATYFTTDDNQPIVDGLTAIPPKKFNFAADVLCLSEGCDVRLIKNINVAAGLVNSTTGQVVAVIYNNADVSLLLNGKNPPAYCVVVDFPGFLGFLTKDDRRIFPFMNNPRYVPIYRDKFIASQSELPSWITKKQSMFNCWRQQFPLDLSRHITTHRAQGQTLADCLVSVDLGLGSYAGRLPPDIGSLLYVACTRVKELKNLFVAPMSLKVWKEFGHNADDEHRRKIEAQLLNHAKNFAKQQQMHKVFQQEISWQPDYSSCENEWQSLLLQQVPPVASMTIPSVVNFNPDNWLAWNGERTFKMCLNVVMSERHIGLDQGTVNFGIAVVDAFRGDLPKLVAAENCHLSLTGRFEASEVLVALSSKTRLLDYMQQSDTQSLRPVDRVVVHIEQMSVKNAHWKQFGLKLGMLLQQITNNPETCIVKMSQPHIHRASGPMFKMGRKIVDQLLLVPASYGKKRHSTVIESTDPTNLTTTNDIHDVEMSDSSSGHDLGETDGPHTSKCLRSNEYGKSIPSVRKKRVSVPTLEEDFMSNDDDYHKKKKMSAKIFDYFVKANDEQQTDMGICIDSDLQTKWKDKLARNPDLKLDDVGDSLLHAVNELLCGSSNYKQLLPSNSAVHENRTVVIRVEQNRTYWVAIHCTWNIFQLEGYGVYDCDFEGHFFKSAETVDMIINNLEPALKIALTDVNGSSIFKPVDHVKTIIKQITGHRTTFFKNELAGCLTQSTVEAAKKICDEAAGPGSRLCDRVDRIFGALYIRNSLTNHKFQVLRSAGKENNAMLCFPAWMNEHAKHFVESRTITMTDNEKVKFFVALQEIASSADVTRLGMLELSDQAKRQLSNKTTKLDNMTKKLLANLILIGISKNQQHVRAVAANYRTPRGRDK